MYDDPVVTVIVIIILVFVLSWAINSQTLPRISGINRSDQRKFNSKNLPIPGFDTEYTDSNPVSYNDIPNQNEESDLERERAAMVDLTRALVRWTAMLALATATGGAILYGQYRELRNASKDTTEAVKAAQDQATASRAHIWIESKEFPKFGTSHEYNMYTVKFNLINYGKTPAIIVKSKVLMYMCPMSVTPIPFDPRYDYCRDKFYWPLDETGSGEISQSLHLDWPPPADIQVIYSNQNLYFAKDFLFENPRKQDPALFQMGRDAWVYCDLFYKDVFGITRETSYFAEIPGGVVTTMAEKYNYWK